MFSHAGPRYAVIMCDAVMRGLQAESLHQKCKLLAAQVNSLKRKCSKLEALEKEMTEVQRARDEQVGLALPQSG